jgi:hypothetical protein
LKGIGNHLAEIARDVEGAPMTREKGKGGAATASAFDRASEVLIEYCRVGFTPCQAEE